MVIKKLKKIMFIDDDTHTAARESGLGIAWVLLDRYTTTSTYLIINPGVTQNLP